LNPLAPDETVGYVESRLARAGLTKQSVFPASLLEEIHHRSRGIPRLINAICDNLLVTAFAMEQRVATVEMLDEVSRDLRLEYPGVREKRGRSRYGLGDEHLSGPVPVRE
jgi:hypothetical protein